MSCSEGLGLQWGHSSEAVDEDRFEFDVCDLAKLQWGHSSEAVDETRLA